MQIWNLHSGQGNPLGLLLYILHFWVPTVEELDFSRLWVGNILYIAASETGRLLVYWIRPCTCCCTEENLFSVLAVLCFGLFWAEHRALYYCFYVSLIIIFKLRSWTSNKTDHFPEELPIMQMHSINILSAFPFHISLYVCVERERSPQFNWRMCASHVGLRLSTRRSS